MKQHRTLQQTIGYGGLVVALSAAAGVLIWIVGNQGIDALNAGRAQEAILAGLACLGAVIVPVVTLAAYLHWLGSTTRDTAARGLHIPSRAEDLMLGLGTLVAVVASAPAAAYCYRQAAASFGEGRADYEIGYGIGYVVAGLAVVGFALLCLSRYVRWMRS